MGTSAAAELRSGPALVRSSQRGKNQDTGFGGESGGGAMSHWRMQPPMSPKGHASLGVLHQVAHTSRDAHWALCAFRVARRGVRCDACT